MLLKIKHKIVELVRLLFSEMIHTELAIENFRAKAAVCEKRGVADLPLLDEPLVVSLTTFGQRIFDVHLVVESIMQQTVLPNRIILWLDETEFNESSLPLSLNPSPPYSTVRMPMLVRCRSMSLPLHMTDVSST